MTVKTRIIEIDSDWLLVCFKGDKPPAEKRAFWMSRTLTDWLDTHPGRIVKRTEPVQFEGELLGVHIWLDKPEAAPSAPRTKERKIRIRQDVQSAMHNEHLEALLQHAHDIFFKDRGRSPALAIISRGGVAVVFDRASEEAHVMRVEELPLAAATAEEYRRWQSDATTNYFVAPLAHFESG